MVLGDIQVARAEENGEQRQDDRDDERGVAGAGSCSLDVDAAQHVHPEHDARSCSAMYGNTPTRQISVTTTASSCDLP